jgi:hypothetical protein
VLEITSDLGFEKIDVVDAPVSLTPESRRHVISSGDGVAKLEMLAMVSGAVVTREVCYFLATLVVAYVGYVVD